MSFNSLHHITCIVPSSPIKSHPSLEIIEKTIESIRYHLPDNEIIITLDGVRKEQEEYRERYEDYIKALLWKCNFEWHNILPVIHDDQKHQVQMAKEVLPLIKTPLLLYIEHDCWLRTDKNIDFEGIAKCVEDGTANMIRLSHEAEVLEPHKQLFFEREEVNGVPLIQTSQWSQRPHVASVAFYDRILTDYFTPEANTMIEDKMYGVVETAAREYGIPGWSQFRLYLYAPGDDYKRSYTTDGREGDAKYDDRFSF